jgi:hypothetical protein
LWHREGRALPIKREGAGKQGIVNPHLLLPLSA